MHADTCRGIFSPGGCFQEFSGLMEGLCSCSMARKATFQRLKITAKEIINRIVTYTPILTINVSLLLIKIAILNNLNALKIVSAKNGYINQRRSFISECSLVLRFQSSFTMRLIKMI